MTGCCRIGDLSMTFRNPVAEATITKPSSAARSPLRGLIGIANDR
jgi:hypothetical protein